MRQWRRPLWVHGSGLATFFAPEGSRPTSGIPSKAGIDDCERALIVWMVYPETLCDKIYFKWQHKINVRKVMLKKLDQRGIISHIEIAIGVITIMSIGLVAFRVADSNSQNANLNSQNEKTVADSINANSSELSAEELVGENDNKDDDTTDTDEAPEVTAPSQPTPEPVSPAPTPPAPVPSRIARLALADGVNVDIPIDDLASSQYVMPCRGGASERPARVVPVNTAAGLIEVTLCGGAELKTISKETCRTHIPFDKYEESMIACGGGYPDEFSLDCAGGVANFNYGKRWTADVFLGTVVAVEFCSYHVLATTLL